jgi:hypothetical protein
MVKVLGHPLCPGQRQAECARGGNERPQRRYRRERQEALQQNLEPRAVGHAYQLLPPRHGAPGLRAGRCRHQAQGIPATQQACQSRRGTAPLTEVSEEAAETQVTRLRHRTIRRRDHPRRNQAAKSLLRCWHFARCSPPPREGLRASLGAPCHFISPASGGTPASKPPQVGEESTFASVYEFGGRHCILRLPGNPLRNPAGRQNPKGCGREVPAKCRTTRPWPIRGPQQDPESTTVIHPSLAASRRRHLGRDRR